MVIRHCEHPSLYFFLMPWCFSLPFICSPPDAMMRLRFISTTLHTEKILLGGTRVWRLSLGQGQCGGS